MSVIRYGSNAVRLPAWAESRLKGYLDELGFSAVLVTSTARSRADQARIMLEALKRDGVAAQRKLYGAGSDKVIDMYELTGAVGVPDKQTLSAMLQVINEIEDRYLATGRPPRVSNHIDTGDGRVVFDVAPSTVQDEGSFLDLLKQRKASGEVGELLWPPTDPAFHIQFVPGDFTQAVLRQKEADKAGPFLKVAVLAIVGYLAWALWPKKVRSNPRRK